MQSMPLLLRQSLRSGLNLSTRTSRPVRAQLPPAAAPALYASRDATRNFSICLQCQFRARPSLSSIHESDKPKDEKPVPATKDSEPTTAVPEAVIQLPPPETHAESQRAAAFSTGEFEQQEWKQENEQPKEQPKETNTEGTEKRSLPSSLEHRRSRLSKQFTVLMDNLQSNIFVAGQRLNDLTGYSAIEALKKEIQNQEIRVREARARVRQAKEAYAAAINNRSTSQREVNELLQRKHAWSATDLERFTHLYRNDHANEVAESETQEALSAAEREAEEAAAGLSKSILSRYHEEQVWSDKIRRMSTWGTWGLMGVNVLLFLIFQIAVEPWRRRRLVKGFEEKVMEAIEKEKALNGLNPVPVVAATQAVSPEGIISPTTPSLSTTQPPATDLSTTPAAAEGETMIAVQSTTSDAPEEQAETPPTPAEATTAVLPIMAATATEEKSTPPTAPPPPTPTTADVPPTTTTTTNTVDNIFETCKSQLSRFPSPSIESWRQALHDLFSDRRIAISQRDLTAVAIQSAAAGAAVTGLIIALIRPR